MDKLISIIIPIYNVEQYLERCLNSVISQTYKNLEIILVDDGSTDNSGKICDEFAQKDDRIIVVHKENGGVSTARNKGLDIATGEYITFVDGDDYLELNTYDNIFYIIDKYNVDIIKFQCIRELKNHKRYSVASVEGLVDSKHEILEVFLKNREFGSVCNAVFKKNIINNFKFLEDVRFGEDYYFCFNAILNSNKIYILNDRYYHYVCIDESATHKFEINKMKTILENHYRVTYLVYKEILEYGYNDYEESCFKNIYIRTNLVLNMLAFNTNYSEYKHFIKNLQNQTFYRRYEGINSFYIQKIENMLNNKRFFYYIKFKVSMFLKQLLKKIIF